MYNLCYYRDEKQVGEVWKIPCTSRLLLLKPGCNDFPKELGNPLTEAQLLRGIRKYITLGVLIREIKMMPLSRLGIVNLHTELENLFTKSQLLRGFRKYITLGVCCLQRYLDIARSSFFQDLARLTFLEHLVAFWLSHNCWEDFENIQHLGS